MGSCLAGLELRRGRPNPQVAFLESSHYTGLTCYLERDLVGRVGRASVHRRELTCHARRGFSCGSFKNTHTAFSLSYMCRKGFVFETQVLCSLFQVCVCWGAEGANFSE